MSKRIILFSLILSLFIIPAIGQLTEDTYSTWSMDPYAWDGKPLPSMGLERSTHHLSLTYNITETGLPDKIDWRNTPYGTRVTPVKDQDGCGSCVAHAIVAQEESAIEIAQNASKPLPDLAEDEFFSHGGNCNNGWIFERAYPVAKDTGIMTQACYDSGSCKDRSYIDSWTTTRDPKTALQVGPIVSGIDWDNDWFYYDGGIINDGSGTIAGGHALEIVGYNDPGQYWIVKNSWGSSWGESGYFRMSYTTAANYGMGTSYPWYTIKVKGSPGPIPPGPTPSNNKTYSARTLSTSGSYVFSEVKPEPKYILTTKSYSKATPFGQYPDVQAFNFSMTANGKTFYSTDKKHCISMKTIKGSWLEWIGLGKYSYRMDSVIEISKS
jgi:hypothetical protein